MLMLGHLNVVFLNSKFVYVELTEEYRIGKRIVAIACKLSELSMVKVG